MTQIPARLLALILCGFLLALGNATATGTTSNKSKPHAAAKHTRRCIQRKGRRKAHNQARCRRRRRSTPARSAPASKPAPVKGSSPVGPVSPTTPAPAAPGTPGAPAETVEGTPTGPPSVPHVQVTAVEYGFTLSRTMVPAGKVIFEFVNNGQDEHNLNVVDGEGEIASSFAAEPSKGVHDQAVEMRAGSYVLFCSLPEHEKKGMKATLVVQ